MKIISLFGRKSGMSRDQFRTYYETVHVPLTLELLSGFSKYRRNYIADAAVEDKKADMSELPADYSQDSRFDVITEVGFENREDFARCMAAMADPAISRRFAEDEEKFIDRTNILTFIVDDVRGDPDNC